MGDNGGGILIFNRIRVSVRIWFAVGLGNALGYLLEFELYLGLRFWL